MILFYFFFVLFCFVFSEVKNCLILKKLLRVFCLCVHFTFSSHNFHKSWYNILQILCEDLTLTFFPFGDLLPREFHSLPGLV